MSTCTHGRQRIRAHAQALWIITIVVLMAVLLVPVQAELNPDFTATPRSGVSPLSVQFNDTSTGFVEPVTYLWDFGDGNTSLKQNPLYTYFKPGTYALKLDIRNASGDQATIMKNDFITVEVPVITEPLNPDFSGTPVSGTAPLTIQFTDASTGPVDLWEWDFGDENTSSKQNPKYTYTQPGSYTIKLVISNASGEQATLIKKDYITVDFPIIPDLLIPDFTGTPRSGFAPLNVQFSDESTGPLDNWEWDFGDGNTSSKQNPLYIYNEPGLYPVKLTISNSSGEQATLLQNDYITVNPAPAAIELIPNFTGTPRSGVSPLTVQFTDTSIGFTGQVTYLWDFGDGNTSSEQNPLYTFEQSGMFSVTLTLGEESGTLATILHKDYITVNSVPAVNVLIPDFNAEPRSGVSPLTVQFNDISTGFVDPISYLWDFGDGNISSKQNPLFTFNEPGLYTVKLDISNASGEQAMIAKKDYINVDPAPAANEIIPDFNGTPRSGVSPLTVKFNDRSTGLVEPVIYLWDFGDGNTSSKQNPWYTFGQSGSYAITLTINQASGALATISKNDYITVTSAPLVLPIADFFGIPTSGSAPLTVAFTDLTTNTPTSWNWSFGDDSVENATEQNPVHTYTNPGDYTVSLNATNADGSDTQSRSEYIKVNAVPLSPPPAATPPIADFSGKPTSGEAPLTVSFTDLSINTPTSWNWSFGDDSLENATEQNPVHTFVDPGNYTVSLNATNEDGSDTQTRSKYITVNPAVAPPSLPLAAPPVADFFAMPTSGKAPLTVTFTDLSTETPTFWNWSFGDNSLENATEQNPVHTYADPGTYTISLNATNADGSDTQIRTDYITVSAIPLAPPVADFSGDPTHGVVPLTVSFTDRSTNTPTSWNWSFGDDSLENATEQNPVHSYADPGNYTISLNATNADGSDTKIWDNYVTVSAVPLAPPILEPLLPNFTALPTSGPAPLIVQFNDTSTGTHDQWEWDFGDGNTSTEQNPLFTYYQPGSYSVTLNISQAGGDSVSTTQEDYITVVTPLIQIPINATPLIPNLTALPTSGTAPLTVQFNDTSTGPHNQWEWNFGDGNTSSEQNPEFTYNEAGSYSVTLNVSQAGGDSASTTQHNYITVSAVSQEPPVADFSGNPVSGNTPLTVTFTDLSTNTPTSWNWSFGDDSLENATEQNPIHTYIQSGNYTISLNATNSAGSNITIRTNYINVNTAPEGAVANFSGTPTSGISPLTVQFNDTSTGFVSPITYFWDFGDGSTSTERNPSHTYTASSPENYTVTLNVTGNYGKTNSIIKSSYISLEIPTIELTFSKELPPAQSLPTNQSSPPVQSLPQSKSVLRTQSLSQAQSLPQSKSALQDQSFPQDISSQKDLSAEGFWVFPSESAWSLSSGDNKQDNAFLMIVWSNSDKIWTVDVRDPMIDKPEGTAGKMAEYDYSPPTPHYVSPGKVLSQPLNVRSHPLGTAGSDDDYIPLSGSNQQIQWGNPPGGIYWIDLGQGVLPTDSSLGTNRGYRIVIFFEATIYP